MCDHGSKPEMPDEPVSKVSPVDHEMVVTVSDLKMLHFRRIVVEIDLVMQQFNLPGAISIPSAVTYIVIKRTGEWFRAVMCCKVKIRLSSLGDI